MKRIMMGLSLMFTLSAYGQGPLTPPGAPGATMKTLAQLEPRTAITNVPVEISSPGSYYFTTNLVCSVSSPQAILVSTSDVSIDLCGFTLQGPDGINMTAIYQANGNGLSVENGCIRDFEGDAIQAGGSQNIFQNLRISDCYYGISAGYNAHVENCSIGPLSNFSGNCVGIYTEASCVLQNCTVADLRGGMLVAGYIVNDHSVISKCTAKNIMVTSGSSGIGFSSGESTLSECSASQCQRYGFLMSGGILRNSLAGGNYQIGVRAVQNSHLEYVTATFNSTNGLQIVNDCVVSHCVASENGFQGIDVIGDRNVISDNLFNRNASSGIFVWEDDNRIENNQVAGNLYGIYLRYWAPDSLAERNIVMRNTALRNTSENFHVGASNWVANIDTTGAFAGANDNYSILP